jgi:hypothetical protein
MKNVLIAVLLIAVVVLGFLLYRGRIAGTNTAGNNGSKMARTPGAKHNRPDHHKPPKYVNTQECDNLVGQNSDICIIPISYIRNMSNPGQDTFALEVRHNDTIVWVGDGGELLNVHPLQGVDCVDQSPDPPSSSPYLTDGPFPAVTAGTTAGSVQFGHVLLDPKHVGYCFKTIVDVTVNGKTTPLDPHMFDLGEAP